MDRFSSTGVKAGTAKRRQVFSTPDAKAISDMHRMYGNITRVIQTAAPNSASRAAPRSPLAMADTTQGAATMPTSVTSISASVSSSATRSSSVRTSSSDRLLRAAPRIGTKACAKAPSANSRRSRFGMRKATQNASVMGPAPKARATRTSRARPEMRDSNVKLLTVAAERNKLTSVIHKSRACPKQKRAVSQPGTRRDVTRLANANAHTTHTPAHGSCHPRR